MTALATNPTASEKLEQALVLGDLAKLTPEERVQYYNGVCQSLGLNPLTQPFAYITLNNKLLLYAKKDCTEQLRTIHGISLTIAAREVVEGVYVVTARATKPDGRTDESIGAVPIDTLKGEARANSYMKAETKAKRRVTLSICGLGLLDESEIESIPGASTGSKEDAQEVAKRKIAELQAPVEEKSEQLSADAARKELTALYFGLGEIVGAENADRFVNGLLARLKVKSTKEMNTEQLNQTVFVLRAEIKKNEPPAPAMEAELVDVVEEYEKRETPLWVEKPHEAIRQAKEKK